MKKYKLSRELTYNKVKQDMLLPGALDSILKDIIQGVREKKIDDSKYNPIFGIASYVLPRSYINAKNQVNELKSWDKALTRILPNHPNYKNFKFLEN